MDSHLVKRLDSVWSRLRAWVECNSFTDNIAGCNQMGELLVNAFDLVGLRHERISETACGDHHVWRTPAWDAGDKRIVLVGHHDTVFPPGTFVGWQERGDRIHGPGVLDMKGGLAVIWSALAALSDAGALASIPLAVISVADEEKSSLQSRPHLERLAQGAAAGLVFEAGRANDLVITQRRGTGRVTVTAHGRAAHAGNDAASGCNAITALAQFIVQVPDLPGPEETATVGLIQGGTSANTVPALASCEIDLRCAARASGDSLLASLHAVAANTSRVTGASLDVQGGWRRIALDMTEASRALYRRYAAAAVAAGLGGGLAGRIGGGSDANTLGAIGVPVIDGLGPRGAHFHTHDEYIETATLSQKADALHRLLAAWH